jgi:hypothetical protein
MSNHIITENGDSLVTENGDFIVWAPGGDAVHVDCNLLVVNAKWPIPRAYIYFEGNTFLVDFVVLPAPACLYPKSRYIIYDWANFAVGALTPVSAGVYDGSGTFLLELPNPARKLPDLVLSNPPVLPSPAGDYVLCVTANIDGDDRQYPGSW